MAERIGDELHGRKRRGDLDDRFIQMASWVSQQYIKKKIQGAENRDNVALEHKYGTALRSTFPVKLKNFTQKYGEVMRTSERKEAEIVRNAFSKLGNFNSDSLSAKELSTLKAKLNVSVKNTGMAETVRAEVERLINEKRSERDI